MSFFKKTSTPSVIEHDQEYANSDTDFYGPQHPALMAYATVARRTVLDHLENYVEVDPFARAEPLVNATNNLPATPSIRE